MILEPITILSALLPAVTDGIRRLIGRWTGGPEPQSVDEIVRLGELDIRRLEALAQLDSNNGNISRTVADIRAMQRPVVVIIVMITWMYAVFFGIPEPWFTIVANVASSVMFYLFGDRTYMYFKRGSNK